MYVVADASVFIWGKRPAGQLITVPAVEAELKDIRTRSLLAIFEARVESRRKRGHERQETSGRFLLPIWMSWPKPWSTVEFSLLTIMLYKM